MSGSYASGEEWLAEQLLTSLRALLPVRLAEIRTTAALTLEQLPDPVSYWPQERFALMEQLNLMPAVMVAIGPSKLLGRDGVEGGTPNTPPVTTPNPAGGPIYLWRTSVRVVAGMHLDQTPQAAEQDYGDTVEDWTLTTRMRSRYAQAITRSILGHQELIPGVLVIEETNYLISPAGAADPNFNRRYAETAHDFTVLWREAIGQPALGYVDPAKLAVTVARLAP